MSKTARVVYASTDHSADALYFTGTHVPDAFVAMEIEGEKLAIVSALEFTRLQKESRLDTVLPMEDYEERIRKERGVDRVRAGDYITFLAQERGVERLELGAEFPALVLKQIEALGMPVDVSEGSVFPERETKSREEAALVAEGNRAVSAAYQEVERVLRESVIVDGKIVHRDHPLTSEDLQELIAITCLQNGALALGTIVAGGDQGCDPHCVGSGELRANELIIVDIFPRVQKTGYYGDMTRTYLKGQPSDAQAKLVETVHEAQKRALAQIKAGASGVAIHDGVHSYFESMGYKTEKRDGVNVGFFHGTGHGLGMEIHEAPRISRKGVGRDLKAGHVVTVEPGLYYPGLGGCRIEDDVWVTETGYELLSHHPYEWVF